MVAMTRVALVQLVSEQTMQNVLPILRLKPVKVYHLATAKTASRSEHILNAVKSANINPQIENIRLAAMPSITEATRAVARAIGSAREEQLTPVVNFTGGTKLMSVGAYIAAYQATPRALSLYVDTDDEQFVDGNTADGLSELFENDLSFNLVRPMITLDIIARANGVAHITKGRAWQQYLDLAMYLFQNPVEALAVHAAISKFVVDTPKKLEEWPKLIDCEFELPERVALLASASGLVRLTAAGKCKLPDITRSQLEECCRARSKNELVNNFDQKRIAATEPLEFTINFLMGGWWEVVVADAAMRVFSNVRWSVKISLPGGIELEEDVVCVDGVRAVCISCKRGGSGARLVAHLEELDARARNLGGNFTRKFLAVNMPLKGKTGTALFKRAAELGVKILRPVDIYRPEAFT